MFKMLKICPIQWSKYRMYSKQCVCCLALKDLFNSLVYKFKKYRIIQLNIHMRKKNVRKDEKQKEGSHSLKFYINGFTRAQVVTKLSMDNSRENIQIPK